MTNYKASEQYAQTKSRQPAVAIQLSCSIRAALKFMRLAKKSMEEGNIHNTNEYLIRSQDIIMELLTTLDAEKGGEVATNLAALYEYMYRELIQANMKKRP